MTELLGQPLADRNGNIIARFAPTDTPEQIEAKICDAINA